jgi:uroporphyrinogen-III synthase
MQQTIFISKSVSDASFLAFCEAHNYCVLDVPMISFKQMEFAPPPATDYEAIFFSSERSVDFFLTKQLPLDRHLLCCIGQKTADALTKWGYSSDFIGKRSGEPNSVAKQLREFIGTEKLLFPQSTISNKSVQKEFPEEQCLNLVVYETFALPTALRQRPDILVFTSPSNVRSFLQMNTVDDKQRVIAWGSSTKHYLTQSNIHVDNVLIESSFKSLIELLSKTRAVN